MNNNQNFTPKYWIAHNKNEDDVYIDTASKSYEESLDKVIKNYYKNSNLFYQDQENGYVNISLIEIKLINQ